MQGSTAAPDEPAQRPPENLLPNPADEGRDPSACCRYRAKCSSPIVHATADRGMLDALLEKVSQIGDPFEQSFFSRWCIAYLQLLLISTSAPPDWLRTCPCSVPPVPDDFLDVPEQAYSSRPRRHEMTCVELLRDPTSGPTNVRLQEYLAITGPGGARPSPGLARPGIDGSSARSSRSRRS